MAAQIQAHIVNVWIHENDPIYLHYTITRAGGGVRRLRTDRNTALAGVLLEYLDPEISTEPREDDE